MNNIPGGIDLTKTQPVLKPDSEEQVQKPVTPVTDEQKKRFKQAEKGITTKSDKKTTVKAPEQTKQGASIFDIASQTDPSMTQNAVTQAGLAAQAGVVSQTTTTQTQPTTTTTVAVQPVTTLDPNQLTSGVTHTGPKHSGKNFTALVDSKVVTDPNAGMTTATNNVPTEDSTQVKAQTNDDTTDTTDTTADTPTQPSTTTVQQPVQNQPMTTPLVASTTNPVNVTPQTRAANINLINNIVSQLTTLTTPDKVVTTVALQNIKGFEGVTVDITQFQTAPKQFNLTFNNLTDPYARQLIESKANQELLKTQLISKGYTIQMIVIEPKFLPTITGVDTSQIEAYTQGNAGGEEATDSTDQQPTQ